VFLLILFTLNVALKPIKLIHIEKEWTDSTTVHSFLVYSPKTESSNQIDIVFYFTNDTLTKHFTTNNFENIFQFKEVKLKSDSLIKIELSQIGNDYKLDYSSKRINKSQEITFSPVLTYKKINSPKINFIPSNNFNPDNDTLYCEFYTEFKKKSINDRFGYYFNIINSNFDTLISYYKRIKNSEYTYNLISIPGAKLQSGKYKLFVEFVRNNESFAKAESNEFYVTNKEKNKKSANTVNKSVSLFSTLFENYTIEELNELFLKAQFISTKKESDLYNNLNDLQSKKAFMISFWENRNESETENFDSYMMRISNVNAIFSTKFAQGIKTEKGKIYMKYGECDDIYTSNMSSETKPYEVWYYPNIQNGIYFFFVDMNGFGDYKMIHSTAQNETYNPSLLYSLGIDKDNYRK